MDIKQYIKTELNSMLKEAKEKTISRATGTEQSRLTRIFTGLAMRAKSSNAKRKLVTQVIQALATSLNISPGDVMRSYRDYRRDVQRPTIKKDEN
jgi:hypothetical protein